MVKLEEVVDEEFTNGPSGEQDWDTDTGPFFTQSSSQSLPKLFRFSLVTRDSSSEIRPERLMRRLTSITDSIVSSDDEDLVPDESLLDRFYALRDMVPPAQRKRLTNTFDKATSWARSGASFSGNTLWILTTSAMLLIGPFATAAWQYNIERDEMARQHGQEAVSSAHLSPYN